ncbi:MAG: hypothetical protein ACRDJE_10820 [Dehalococcoidia bacterium]
MSGKRRASQPPPRVLDRVAQWVLTLTVPEHLREALIGDLIEEAHRFIAPERGLWRARLWLWGQIVGSLPALLGRRDTTEGAMDVKLWKLIVLPLVLVALAQAWDSQVFDASPLVVGMVLAAIALPIAAIFLTARLDLYCAALVVGFLLLLTARIVSSTPLPDLFLVLFPLAVLALLTVWQRRKDTGRPGGAAT